jgi:hypothetical protein
MIAFLLGALIVAQATAPPASTPADIYKRAVMAMRAVHDPAYLRFDLDERFTHAASVVVFAGEELERTQDRGAYLRLTSDPGAKPKHYTLPIPPDLFLKSGAGAGVPSTDSQLVSGLDNSANPLKTIASVQAIGIHYAIDSLPDEDIPGCASALHLRLAPSEDPLRYNLRELWINPGTFQICRAIAIWRAPVAGHMQDVSVSLDVDPNGFVEHWQISTTARALLGSYSLQQETSYRNIQPTDETAWSSFGGN